MCYSPWGHKESDTTEQLNHSNKGTAVKGKKKATEEKKANTQNQKLRDLKYNTNLFSHCSGDQKSEITVSAGYFLLEVLGEKLIQDSPSFCPC